MIIHTVIAIFVLCFCLENINSLSIVPERTKITYCNEKYAANVTVNVRRSSRRGEYVLNIMAHSVYEAGNNVSFNVIVYEHSTRYNQYTKTFIEFHHRVCDMIHHDKIFGAVLRKLGVTQCPIPAGPLSWTNMTLKADFDFYIPFVRGKAEVNLNGSPTNELLLSGVLFFRVDK